MQINEYTDIDKLLSHVDPKYWDLFCEAWYQGLEPYKHYPESLLLFANAVLAHWSIPYYAQDIAGWDDEHDCFIWKFRSKSRKKSK